MGRREEQKAAQGEPSFIPILVRMLERFDNVWADEALKGRSPRKRFGYAFAGALTFSFMFFVLVIGDEIPSALVDETMGWVLLTTVSLGTFVVSVWFGWLVSSRDMGYGPTRLYLSGMILPMVVWLLLKKSLL